eukprot:Hpha_TRINITY_DN15713_c2_g3::TRINITY_DN15713_c2_g3_i1::g.40972::m.40972
MSDPRLGVTPAIREMPAPRSSSRRSTKRQPSTQDGSEHADAVGGIPLDDESGGRSPNRHADPVEAARLAGERDRYRQMLQQVERQLTQSLGGLGQAPPSESFATGPRYSPVLGSRPQSPSLARAQREHEAMQALNLSTQVDEVRRSVEREATERIERSRRQTEEEYLRLRQSALDETRKLRRELEQKDEEMHHLQTRLHIASCDLEVLRREHSGILDREQATSRVAERLKETLRRMLADAQEKEGRTVELENELDAQQAAAAAAEEDRQRLFHALSDAVLELRRKQSNLEQLSQRYRALERLQGGGGGGGGVGDAGGEDVLVLQAKVEAMAEEIQRLQTARKVECGTQGGNNQCCSAREEEIGRLQSALADAQGVAAAADRRAEEAVRGLQVAFADAQAAAAAAERRAQEAETQLTAASAALNRQGSAWNQGQADIQELRTALADAQSMASSRVEEVESRLAAVNAQSSAREEEIKQLRSTLQDTQGTDAQSVRLEEVESQLAAANAQSSEREEEIKRLRSALAEAQGAAAAERQEEVERLRSELAEAHSAVADEKNAVAAASRRAEEAATASAALSSQSSEREEEIKRLGSALKEAQDAAAAAERRAEEAAGQLETASTVLGTREREHAEISKQLASKQEEAEADRQRFAQRSEELANLTEQLERTQKELEEARQQAEAHADALPCQPLDSDLHPPTPNADALETPPSSTKKKKRVVKKSKKGAEGADGADPAELEKVKGEVKDLTAELTELRTREAALVEETGGLLRARREADKRAQTAEERLRAGPSGADFERASSLESDLAAAWERQLVLVQNARMFAALHRTTQGKLESLADAHEHALRDQREASAECAQRKQNEQELRNKLEELERVSMERSGTGGSTAGDLQQQVEQKQKRIVELKTQMMDKNRSITELQAELTRLKRAAGVS